MFETLQEMDRRHWSAALAGFLGWTLDALASLSSGNTDAKGFSSGR